MSSVCHATHRGECAEILLRTGHYQVYWQENDFRQITRGCRNVCSPINTENDQTDWQVLQIINGFRYWILETINAVAQIMTVRRSEVEQTYNHIHFLLKLRRTVRGIMHRLTYALLMLVAAFRARHVHFFFYFYKDAFLVNCETNIKNSHVLPVLWNCHHNCRCMSYNTYNRLSTFSIGWALFCFVFQCPRCTHQQQSRRLASGCQLQLQRHATIRR